MAKAPRTPRKRDAEATRQAILDAAGDRFGHASYDQVSMREIAALAGVDVALVGRYFGSKEKLFAEWFRQPRRLIDDLPAERSRFGEHIVRELLIHDADMARKFALHHSVAEPGPAKLVRELLHEGWTVPLGKWIGGADGELRAALVLGQIIGLAMLRWGLEADPLAKADIDDLVGRFGRAVQSCIDD